jgi:hypothetical protein
MQSKDNTSQFIRKLAKKLNFNLKPYKGTLYAFIMMIFGLGFVLLFIIFVNYIVFRFILISLGESEMRTIMNIFLGKESMYTNQRGGFGGQKGESNELLMTRDMVVMCKVCC